MVRRLPCRQSETRRSARIVSESTAAPRAGNGAAMPSQRWQPDAELRIRRPERGTVVVDVSGEHDLATREAVQELLIGLVEENAVVVVDLTEATFIDSSFLYCLVEAHKCARRRGSQLRVRVGESTAVRRALEVSNLYDYLGCESLDSAGRHDVRRSGVPIGSPLAGLLFEAGVRIGARLPRVAARARS